VVLNVLEGEKPLKRNEPLGKSQTRAVRLSEAGALRQTAKTNTDRLRKQRRKWFSRLSRHVGEFAKHGAHFRFEQRTTQSEKFAGPYIRPLRQQVLQLVLVSPECLMNFRD